MSSYAQERVDLDQRESACNASMDVYIYAQGTLAKSIMKMFNTCAVRSAESDPPGLCLYKLEEREHDIARRSCEVHKKKWQCATSTVPCTVHSTRTMHGESQFV